MLPPMPLLRAILRSLSILQSDPPGSCGRIRCKMDPEANPTVPPQQRRRWGKRGAGGLVVLGFRSLPRDERTPRRQRSGQLRHERWWCNDDLELAAGAGPAARRVSPH